MNITPIHCHLNLRPVSCITYILCDNLCICTQTIYSAPTDDAFALLPDGIVNQLLLPENVEILRNILLLHVIEGEIDSSMVSSGFVTTLSGVDIEAVVSDSGISFNDSRVIQADLEANNGIIHVIDGVLLPPVE